MPAGHSSPPDTGVPQPHVPLLSGRYRLDSVLGHGGVGTVWRARDLQLDRDVAVKQLQPGVASDPVAADRFRREATTAASLSHPSLVTIYDVGEDDGVVYLVMELVEGPSVKHVLARGGALEPGEVAALGHRVAGALVAVHRRHLVHRDVKPGNVLLPVDGPPKLVDFGTVHVLGDAAATLTTPGTMMGTIGYVAPEQLEGHDVDPRADVYAVGLLLHECLTGEPTFGSGTIAELMRRRVADDAEPPSRRRTGIPPSLDEIVVRATLRDPARRFADAEALVAALEPLVPGDADARLRALARQHAPQAGRTATPPTDEAPSGALEETAVLPRADAASAPSDPPGARRLAPPVVPPEPVVPSRPAPDPRDGGHDTTSVLPTEPADDRRPGQDPPADPDTGRDRRVLLALFALGAVAVVLAVLGLGAPGDDPSGEGRGGGAGGDAGGDAATTVEVVGGRDHDPFGGDGEHPEDVPQAFDGDPATRWQTQRYNSPTLDKPGVGMWVQAAAGSQPRRVEIDLDIPGADVEVYALDGEPAADPAAWGQPVATQSDAEGTLAHDLPEGTNVVLVWFTSAGDDAGGHRAGISEIRLLA